MIPKIEKSEKTNKKTQTKEVPEIRKTVKWRILHDELIKDKKMYKNKETFLAHIDKLASLAPVDQNNIMASYKDFYKVSKKD